MGHADRITFVCLHGTAKSVIAAAYLEQLARARGIAVQATAAGLEPEPTVPPAVVDALGKDGIDLRGFRPHRVTRTELEDNWRVISFGCDLSDVAPSEAPVVWWDDVPLVSDGVEAAREAIRRRVRSLLDEYCAARKP